VQGKSEGFFVAEGLLNYCGISCTVPSIEYVKAISALLKRPLT
jgi:hypothetical protein